MEDEIQYTSKTKKKKEAEELQQLGLELSKLPVPQLERIEIPENLRTALKQGKSITSNVAGRRHRQFIGVLMRDVNPEVIRAALMQAENKSPVKSKATKKTRIWIERLLTGDLAKMEALLYAFPGIDRQRLRQLVRNIKKEKPDAKASKSRKALEQIILSEISHS